MSLFGSRDSDTDEEYDAKAPPEHSDDFKDRHHCTDVCCCFGFLAFLVCWCGLYGWAMVEGDTGRLYHGIDYLGRICGVDPGVENDPILYWCPKTGILLNNEQINMDGLDLANPVCVASCPKSDSTGEFTPSSIPQCEAQQYTDKPYNTDVVMGRYCLPDSLTNAAQAQAVADSPGLKMAETLEAVAGVENGYPIYIGAFVLSVILGYMYIGFLKACAKILVWASIFIAIIGMAAMGVYLLMTANNAGDHDVYAHLGENAVWVTFVTGGVFCILSVLMLFTACCCAGQVQLAVMAVQMTGEVMMEMPMMLLAPVVKALVKFSMMCAMIYGLVKLFSTAEPVTEAGNSYYRHFELSGAQWGMILFYALGCYWLLHFTNGIYQFSIAYATADFYFTHTDHNQERDVHCCFVGEGTIVGLMYHSGSIAFGSFIIAIFEVVQRCVEYAEKVNQSGGQNPITCIVSCVLCFTKCCLACCQSCIEFINKNAYIDMAITSKPFCAAARNAMAIIAKLAGAMYVLNGATYIFQLAGMAMITAVVGLLGYTISYNFFNDSSSDWFIENHAFVTIVVCIIAAGVAYSFMAVFDMVSDTLLYCMGVDGGAHAPHQLQDFVNEAQAEASGATKGRNSRFG